ncbi:MAG: DUF1848 domain-containing protein [Candidatus Aminicenantes bacterium]|nr:DUF1848 domain-containing protein [Candidatus Aminicenantes bacterium]
MIVSVSRRCDVPAFQGQWFMEQLRRGAVEVRNPFRPGQSRQVGLRRGEVDAFVFWSRDPRPFLRHLPEVERGGHPYYFLLTVTGYPRFLEPAVPGVDEAVSFFRELAARCTRRRVVWRYDPVLFTPELDSRFHSDNFSRLAGLLAPFAFRAIVSFFDPYRKALRRLRKAGIDGEAAAGTTGQHRDLLARFAASAADAGLEIQTCAETVDSPVVPRGKCIDDALLNDRFGLELPYRKDPAQRRLCLCQQSVDIGAYGACGHGCLYCYAR